MITDLWIENFKGIGKRQHIPLRPITLLFGANSAGKSTVLHAFMYLREILCQSNLNPTRPIAGENTVNLGGFEKLIRRTVVEGGVGNFEEEATNSMTFGCRFVVEPQKQFGSQSGIWEERFYQSQVAAYLTDPVVRPDDGLSSETKIHYEDSPVDAYCSELWLTIASNDGLARVQSFEWKVDQQPLMSSFKLPSGEMSCWVNTHHKRLNPTLTLIDSNALYNFWELAAKQFAFTDSVGLEHLLSTVARQVGDLLTESRYAIFETPLICPKWSGKFGSLVEQLFQFGADFAHLVLSSAVVSLAQLDELFPHARFSRQDWEEISADVLIGFDRTLKVEESLGTGTTILFVAVPEHLANDAGKILERIRFLFTGTALSGDFIIALDNASLPHDRLPLFDVTDEIAAMYGASTGNAWWFPQQLARIDQTVRVAIRQLRSYLNDICYIGPKRSSVPRNLNESVLDEYSSWGNGLGAWRWLLNRNNCPDPVFANCSQWLADSASGLGTGYALRRDGILEMTFEQLRLYYEGGFDVDKLKHSMRIELLDARSNTTRHPQEVGEGITQLVPVIAASVRTAENIGGGQLVAIEQPELHLHPCVAAKVGDLFISNANGRRHNPLSFDPRFLIETHSEHLILRILRRIRQTTNGELPEHIPPVKPDDVCVLWVDNLGDGTTFQRLRIDEQGEFIDRWPMGFFSERAEELF
jgi:predicted ATPase